MDVDTQEYAVRRLADYAGAAGHLIGSAEGVAAQLRQFEGAERLCDEDEILRLAEVLENAIERARKIISED